MGKKNHHDPTVKGEGKKGKKIASHFHQMVKSKMVDRQKILQIKDGPSVPKRREKTEVKTRVSV